MIKTCNLISILDAKNNLDDTSLQNYFNYFGIEIVANGCKSGIKKSELDDIEKFCQKIKKSDGVKINFFDGFYIGYHIPQIGKEFDLLRIGKNYIINIEIKSQADAAKVKEQLLKNKYYLGFLERQMCLYSYIVNTDSFYSLTEHDEIVNVSLEDILTKISSQYLETIENIDMLFKPSHYLVSPFNSTDKFIEGRYFLTNQQFEIKENILRLLQDKNAHFISLTGAAGTGKTLLVYDVVKHFIEQGKKVLILHCAQLNTGQKILVENYNWNISSTKYGINNDFSSFDLIIVDEAQRATQTQFETIVKKVQEEKNFCIFAYDQKQYLANKELLCNIPQKIECIPAIDSFKLTDKIRTNKAIASFIRQLFNSKRARYNCDYSHVHVIFFESRIKARMFLKVLQQDGWRIPQYTPSNLTKFQYEDYLIDNEDSTHAIIGQEFDKVAAVIDEYFYYDNNGQLLTKNSQCYSQSQMLFQILTRTREDLYLVVINNSAMLKRCLEIIHEK